MRPNPPIVLTKKLQLATKYTVVVPANDSRLVGIAICCKAPTAAEGSVRVALSVLNVAETITASPAYAVAVVAPLPVNPTNPLTSQSPAVSEMLVISAVVPVVNATADPAPTAELTYSPITPTDALSLVVVPTKPTKSGVAPV